MVSTHEFQNDQQEEVGHTHCVLDPRCGSRELFDLITGKWAVLLISSLADGPKRSNALHREVEGISQKMLVQTLRGLEANGLVERKVYPVVPPKVEYSLTPLGETLVGIGKAMCVWAEEHLGEVEQAREQAGLSGFRC
jgi:DNA-binding HxlR family transcriptional regulator